MPKDINLLPRILENEVKRSEYQRVGSLISLGLIVGVVVVVVGLFAWSLIIDFSLKNVESQSESRQKGIEDNLDKELKIRALGSKLKLLKPLLDVPYHDSDIISRIQEVSQTTPLLETSEVVIEGTNVTFTGRAPSSQVLQDYLTTLLDSKLGGKSFSKVFLVSLNRSETLTEYRFSVRMQFTPVSQEAKSNAT